MRKRYLLVACTSSAALNLCNRDEVAVRPRDARLVQVPHVRLRVVRDSAACQDRRPNPHMTSSSIYLLCLDALLPPPHSPSTRVLARRWAMARALAWQGAGYATSDSGASWALVGQQLGYSLLGQVFGVLLCGALASDGLCRQQPAFKRADSCLAQRCCDNPGSRQSPASSSPSWSRRRRVTAGTGRAALVV